LSLIKSISGFRGTIGGPVGENLTPVDIVESTAAYGAWLLKNKYAPKVVIGRDARPSGPMVNQLVVATLQGLGIEVVDLGLSTTPTVEMAVPHLNAGGGIILTASHNPRQWNALKLLNNKGEFISGEDGKDLLQLIEDGGIEFAEVDDIGAYSEDDEMLGFHINEVLSHDLVAVEEIRAKKYKIVVDGVNSSGSIAIPAMLKELNCEVIIINETPDGNFAHNPEPLPQNLVELCETVKKTNADLGIAVDPDVDRLALIGPGGTWIGEEYTLVTVADYVLAHRDGAAVSNLSSSRALSDIAKKHGRKYFASAVGEVNVVQKMKEVNAVIGGEGNGGIIDPALHYGRDSLIGAALVLSHITLSGHDMNALRNSYPDYFMVKDKVNLSPELDVEAKLSFIQKKYAKEASINTIDGVKLDFEEGWIHLRRSNTEPIVRIYGEAKTAETAQTLANRVKADFNL